MTIKTKIKSYPGVVGFFKEITFYNKHIKKQKLNALKTLICFLNFLIKTNQTFRGCTK